RLSGLHPVEPAPLEDVTVRAGAEAVPDVSPAACRPHVELPGALPVLHARAMRLARQPLVGPVVVDDEPVARVRGGGAGWPPTELGPRDDPHQSLTQSEEHTSELQSRENLVCRLLLEKKKAERG